MAIAVGDFLYAAHLKGYNGSKLAYLDQYEVTEVKKGHVRVEGSWFKVFRFENDNTLGSAVEVGTFVENRQVVKVMKYKGLDGDIHYWITNGDNRRMIDATEFEALNLFNSEDYVAGRFTFSDKVKVMTEAEYNKRLKIGILHEEDDITMCILTGQHCETALLKELFDTEAPFKHTKHAYSATGYSDNTFSISTFTNTLRGRKYSSVLSSWALVKIGTYTIAESEAMFKESIPTKKDKKLAPLKVGNDISFIKPFRDVKAKVKYKIAKLHKVDSLNRELVKVMVGEEESIYLDSKYAKKTKIGESIDVIDIAKLDKAYGKDSRSFLGNIYRTYGFTHDSKIELI